MKRLDNLDGKAIASVAAVVGVVEEVRQTLIDLVSRVDMWFCCCWRCCLKWVVIWMLLSLLFDDVDDRGSLLYCVLASRP